MSNLHENCKKLRKITGLGMANCKHLLLEHGTIDSVIKYLKSKADFPEYVASDKKHIEVYKNGELIKTFDSFKDYDKFNPCFQWQLKKEYTVKVIDSYRMLKTMEYK